MDCSKEVKKMKPIKVGLLGIGTVGSGTFNVLKRNQEEIQRRAGRGIEIAMVADLDVARAKAVVGEGVQVVADARAVIANPEIDIVIELIGGYGIAKALVLELGGVARAHRHHAAVDVQLAHNRTPPALELRAERLRRAFAQAQEAHQDVQLGVFVREECLPPTIGSVVTPNQLHLWNVASACAQNQANNEGRDKLHIR